MNILYKGCQLYDSTPFLSLFPCGVYSSAFDTENNVKVALKKLARPFQTNVHSKRTFREFKYLQHMKHENVK